MVQILTMLGSAIVVAMMLADIGCNAEQYNSAASFHLAHLLSDSASQLVDAGLISSDHHIKTPPGPDASCQTIKLYLYNRCRKLNEEYLTICPGGNPSPGYNGQCRVLKYNLELRKCEETGELEASKNCENVDTSTAECPHLSSINSRNEAGCNAAAQALARCQPRGPSPLVLGSTFRGNCYRHYRKVKSSACNAIIYAGRICSGGVSPPAPPPPPGPGPGPAPPGPPGSSPRRNFRVRSSRTRRRQRNSRRVRRGRRGRRGGRVRRRRTRGGRTRRIRRSRTRRTRGRRTRGRRTRRTRGRRTRRSGRGRRRRSGRGRRRRRRG